MLIKLPKNHKFKEYCKNNKIDVSDSDCENHKCFQPHNFNYTLGNGKVVNSWKCRTRQYSGCPEDNSLRMALNAKQQGDILGFLISTTMFQTIKHFSERFKKIDLGAISKEEMFKINEDIFESVKKDLSEKYDNDQKEIEDYLKKLRNG